MCKRFTRFIIFTILTLWIFPTGAFAKCSDSFDKIDYDCIRKNSSKFKQIKLLINKLGSFGTWLKFSARDRIMLTMKSDDSKT